MPEPLRPTDARTFGRKNHIHIPTIASAALAPTVAEATAASALDITRILFAGGEPTPTGNQNRFRLPRRVGDDGDYEARGTISWEGGNLIMAVDPQAAAASDGKKAWEKFQAGTTGFLAKRSNVVRATALAAGQFLTWVLPTEYGQPVPIEQGDNEGTVEAFNVPFYITGEPKFMVAILA